MIDCRHIIERAQRRLAELKDGNSVGAIMKGDPMVSGTQIFATRAEATDAAEGESMSEKERQIMSEASTVVEEMARDIVEEINRGFLA